MIEDKNRTKQKIIRDKLKKNEQKKFCKPSRVQDLKHLFGIEYISES